MATLQACPCYCRLQGFSEASQRFLHHKEAAILLGVPSDIQYVLPPRANLALLGLIASPLQSTWVCASLLANFAQATNAIQSISPRAAIQSLQDRLLCQWRLKLTVHRSDGPEVSATTFATATADSVMLAERIHAEWGSTTKLTQLHNEHSTTTVWTHQRRKKQRTLPPTQPVDICIIHEDVMRCTTVAAGSFRCATLASLPTSSGTTNLGSSEQTRGSGSPLPCPLSRLKLLGFKPSSALRMASPRTTPALVLQRTFFGTPCSRLPGLLLHQPPTLLYVSFIQVLARPCTHLHTTSTHLPISLGRYLRPAHTLCFPCCRTLHCPWALDHIGRRLPAPHHFLDLPRRAWAPPDQSGDAASLRSDTPLGLHLRRASLGRLSSPRPSLDLWHHCPCTRTASHHQLRLATTTTDRGDPPGACFCSGTCLLPTRSWSHTLLTTQPKAHETPVWWFLRSLA